MDQTSEGLSLAPTDLGNFPRVPTPFRSRSGRRPRVDQTSLSDTARCSKTCSKKGMEHEEAYRGWLRDQGLAVVDASGT